MIRYQTTTWGDLEIFYDDLALAPTDLADAAWLRQGVARVEWKRHSVNISTGPYAGRLLIPGRCVIDVLELVPGTVEALLPLAYSGVRRAEEVGAAGVASVPPWAALLNRYGELLYEYVRTGIERRYLPRPWDTSLPRGRIDLKRTVTLHRSRGRPDVLRCVVRELTEDTAFHRILVTAAARADRILGVGPPSSGIRSLRRSLAAFTAVPVETSPDIRRARLELGSNASPEMAGLLDLAELIIKGVSALPDAEVDREQPASVWINVDAIFEQAVRKVITSSLEVPVRAGYGDGTKLLHGGEDMDANPDVVIEAPSGVVIADAKYRRHGADVDRDELYQLMAHSLAYGAERAALVTPQIRPTDTDRFLGTDLRGCIYEVVAVQANNQELFRSQLQSWLEKCGLETPHLVSAVAKGVLGPSAQVLA